MKCRGQVRRIFFMIMHLSCCSNRPARQFFNLPWPPGFHLPDKIDGKKQVLLHTPLPNKILAHCYRVCVCVCVCLCVQVELLETLLTDEIQRENPDRISLLLMLFQRLLTNSNVYKVFRKHDLEVFKTCLNIRDDKFFPFVFPFRFTFM